MNKSNKYKIQTFLSIDQATVLKPYDTVLWA